MRTLKHLALAALLALPLASQAAFINFTAHLTGDQENPSNGSAGDGSATGIFDTVSHEFTWVVTATGLTGGATRAHFHGNTDAPPGHTDDNRPILLAFIDVPNPALVDTDVQTLLDTLTGHTVGTYIGTVDLDLVPSALANLDGLLHNEWYVNIHNSDFPGGEIRGQFFRSTPVPVPAAAWLFGSAVCALAARRRARA